MREHETVKTTAAADDSEPEFSTVDELARRTRLDRKTLYQAIEKGEIPGARRIGRTIRVHTRTFLDWFGDTSDEDQV